MRTLVRRAGVLAICLTGLACTQIVVSAEGGEEPRYDGSLDGFRTFALTFDRDWPQPAELAMFEGKDGARLRYAHWPAPDPERRAGVVVFFQGRTEFIEKNIYAYQDLLARNYEVWTLDWRGQGLSERLIADEPEKGHIDSYRTYLDDAEIFLSDIVQLDRIENAQKVLVAHSMGGAIGALYLLGHPDHFDRAVFSAPLIRLPKLVDNKMIRAGNRAKIALSPTACTGIFADCRWRSEFKDGVDVCAIGEGDIADALLDPDNTARYSHDFKKIAEIECWIVNNRPAIPSLGLGGTTSGWLRATYKATDKINAGIANLATPLLIVGGEQDDIVSNAGQAAFCDADNPSCCRIEVAKAGHELLIESEPLRKQFISAFDAFVATEESPAAFCESFR
ncbi:MAG: alpha/beta hydrolase [Alphaproteobacteria bacterium]|nr:alpha/beta hydrolase [Alphaproteobacteria bacterium]